MSIVFHHYKQLTECISEVEQIEAKVECLVQQKKEVRVATIAATCTAVKVIRILIFKFKQKRKVSKIHYYIYLIYYTKKDE
jgi:uncharacterized protein (UPF0335 family)